MGGAEQQFCLRWNNHQSTLVSVFEALLESETLVDVTLAAEGRFLKAHKVVLCACSPFFQELLSSHLEKYPIIVLKDVTFQELKALIDYMYRGEVNVSQEQLAALIKTAESLKIKGLADGGSDKHKKQPSPVATSSPVPPPPPPPPQQQQQQQPPSAPPAEHRNSPVNNVREGSASPVSRKRRKRSRRRSGDSVEGSVESSLSEPPAGEIMDAEKERVIRALGLVPPSALLEPKAEEIEEEEEESVDLMLDEEHTSEGKDSERPGPSHEGLQSSGAGLPLLQAINNNKAGDANLEALYTMLDRTGTTMYPQPPTLQQANDNYVIPWPPVYVSEKFIVHASGRSVEITTRKYSACVVKQALEEVLNGTTMSKASEKFNIKRSTLYFYFKKLYPDPVEFNNKLSKVL